MLYAGRRDSQGEERLQELVLLVHAAGKRLADAEFRLAEQDQLIEALYLAPDDGEVWADVLDDR